MLLSDIVLDEISSNELGGAPKLSRPAAELTYSKPGVTAWNQV